MNIQKHLLSSCSIPDSDDTPSPSSPSPLSPRATFQATHCSCQFVESFRLFTVSKPISPIYCPILTEHQQTSSLEKTNLQAWQALHTGSGQVNVTVIVLKSCLSFGPHSVSSSYPGWSQAILYFQCSALELFLLCISHHVLSYTK